MWNFIKGLFKFTFGTILTLSLLAGVGAVVFAFVFKKTLKTSKTKRNKSFLILNLMINHVNINGYSICYNRFSILSEKMNSSYI